MEQDFLFFLGKKISNEKKCKPILMIKVNKQKQHLIFNVNGKKGLPLSHCEQFTRLTMTTTMVMMMM